MKRENLKIIKIVGSIVLAITVICGVYVIVRTIISHNVKNKEEEDFDFDFWGDRNID